MTMGVLNNLAAMGKQLLRVRKNVNIVAVHSRQTNLSPELIERFYDYAIEWMNSLGVEPKSFSSYGVSGFQEAKNYSFTNANKKIRKRGFQNIENIGISATPPIKPIFEVDPHVEVSITSAQVAWGVSRIVWAWGEKYKLLDSNVVKELLEQAEHFGLADYAFSSSINSNEYPSAIADLSAFDKRQKGEYLVRGDLAKLCFESNVHSVDLIKDVYPYQLLAKKHLSYQVHDRTLLSWIESDKTYGVLTKISEDRWLWEISEDTIDMVRKILIANNLLTCYLPDLSKVLQVYGKAS